VQPNHPENRNFVSFVRLFGVLRNPLLFDRTGGVCTLHSHVLLLCEFALPSRAFRQQICHPHQLPLSHWRNRRWLMFFAASNIHDLPRVSSFTYPHYNEHGALGPALSVIDGRYYFGPRDASFRLSEYLSRQRGGTVVCPGSVPPEVYQITLRMFRSCSLLSMLRPIWGVLRIECTSLLSRFFFFGLAPPPPPELFVCRRGTSVI
jgi:hypothetical protein